MPELPEVEAVRRGLVDGGLPGSRIVDVKVQWARTVGGDAARFGRAVRGRRFGALERRGKYLIMLLEGGGAIVAHLRMSGRLSIAPQAEPPSGYERVAVVLDGARELRFHDPRKFGRFEVHDDLGSSAVASLAREPLGSEFTVAHVRRYAAGRRRMLKPLLLDQRAMAAGIGNIYADEALWAARLHPCRRSDTLTGAEAARLHAAVREVLERGVRNAGTSLGKGKGNFLLPGGEGGGNQEELKVFRRTGLECPRCRRAAVERLVVGQRATHICPRCQRL